MIFSCKSHLLRILFNALWALALQTLAFFKCLLHLSIVFICLARNLLCFAWDIYPLRAKTKVCYPGGKIHSVFSFIPKNKFHIFCVSLLLKNVLVTIQNLIGYPFPQPSICLRVNLKQNYSSHIRTILSVWSISYAFFFFKQKYRVQDLVLGLLLTEFSLQGYRILS